MNEQPLEEGYIRWGTADHAMPGRAGRKALTPDDGEAL
jgi:hypothetical protein